MSFTIQHARFEGPIHLLLHLIEERKLHISEISLANVTQDYIAFIETNGKTLSDSSQFVVVAATLLLIKARALLPNLPVTDEETRSIETLVNRIELLQMIRERSDDLGDLFDMHVIYPSPYQKEYAPVFAPHDALSLASLHQSVADLLAILPPPPKLQETSVRKVVNIEEVIQNLVERFKSGISYSFGTALNRYKDAPQEEKKVAKHDAIVTFLALLELAKKGIAALHQTEQFATIEATSA